MDQVPNLIRRCLGYQGTLLDPVADGNCGFQCIAEVIHKSQNYFKRVRSSMAEQLVGERKFFTKILGGPQDFERVLESFKGPEGHKAEEKYWLSNLDMGQLIATTFSRPICFWSWSQ